MFLSTGDGHEGFWPFDGRVALSGGRDSCLNILSYFKVRRARKFVQHVSQSFSADELPQGINHVRSTAVLQSLNLITGMAPPLISTRLHYCDKALVYAASRSRTETLKL